MTASTRHDVFAEQDYARLAKLGMTTARDGVRWDKVERHSGFDFSSVKPLLDAARRHRVSVIWDLMHFGWPEDVDVFAPSFPTRFARYARAFASWLSLHIDERPFIVPINEMSFLAWAGGDVRSMNPFEAARGVELKAQLVRATIEAIEAVRDVIPLARFVQPEPVINIVANPQQPKTLRRVESDNLLQYQAWDMLTGRVWPSLGGNPKYLDIIGINYYPDNQFTLDGNTLPPNTKPLSRMLLEVWARYRRPMFVSETGAEGDDRAEWLRFVCDQYVLALEEGCDLHGVTLYPVLNHPGWIDNRHCQNGLWDYADDGGERKIHQPLATEIERQRPRLLAARERRPC